jgi:hypothetical protein
VSEPDKHDIFLVIFHKCSSECGKTILLEHFVFSIAYIPNSAAPATLCICYPRMQLIL